AAGTENLLAMIDIVHESVECAHALLDARGQPAPFRSTDHARHYVERDEALSRLLVTVDSEGDPGAPEEHLGLFSLAPQFFAGVPVEPSRDRAIGLTRPLSLTKPPHLVEGHAARLLE